MVRTKSTSFECAQIVYHMVPASMHKSKPANLLLVRLVAGRLVTAGADPIATGDGCSAGSGLGVVSFIGVDFVSRDEAVLPDLRVRSYAASLWRRSTLAQTATDLVAVRLQ